MHKIDSVVGQGLNHGIMEVLSGPFRSSGEDFGSGDVGSVPGKCQLELLRRRQVATFQETTHDGVV